MTPLIGRREERDATVGTKQRVVALPAFDDEHDEALGLDVYRIEKGGDDPGTLVNDKVERPPRGVEVNRRSARQRRLGRA